MTKRLNILLKSWRNLGRWDKIRLGLLLILITSISLSFLIVKLRIGYKKSASERTPNVGFAVWMQCLKESSDKRGDEYLAAIDGCLTLGGMRSPTATPIPTVAVTATPSPTSATETPTPVPTAAPTGMQHSGRVEFSEAFTIGEGLRFPGIASEQGSRTHYTWWDPTAFHIWYRVCGKTMLTCEPAEKVSAGGGKSYYSSIALDTSDRPHIVWTTNLVNGGYTIFYSRYDGDSWTSPKQISSEETSEVPHISIGSDNTVHIVYQSKENNTGHIYYTSSSDNGAHWSDHEKIGDGFFPDITLDAQNKPYIAWNGLTPGGVYFRYRSAEGWSETVTVSTGHKDQTPDIDIDEDNNLHVVWTKYDAYAISYAKYRDNKRIDFEDSVGGVAKTFWPKIMVDDVMNVHLVFQGRPSGAYGIYYRAQLNGRWDDVITITQTSIHQQTPNISLNNANGSLVYFDSSKNLWARPFILK